MNYDPMDDAMDMIDLTPALTARLFERFLETGKTIGEIAAEAETSVATIEKLLGL